MILSALARVTRRRTGTTSVIFSDADMADALTAANELVHARIRKYLDNFRPTAWATADVTTGTLSPIFDADFHDLVSLYASIDKATEQNLPTVPGMLRRISILEKALDDFYGSRNYKVFTVTIATPAVITSPNHGLRPGARVTFVTSGALPTGLSADTFYYIITAGWTCDVFELSATKEGTAINTSGSQSGTHYYTSDQPARIMGLRQNNK